MEFQININDVIRYEDVKDRTDIIFVLIDDWKMGVLDYSQLKLNFHEDVDLVLSVNKERAVYLVFKNPDDAFWFRLIYGEFCK